MDSAMDFTRPKKIRKLDSGDVGTDDLYDKPKPPLSESQTKRIQVKDDENESKSKAFEDKSDNISPDDPSSPPKKIQKIQSGDDHLQSEDYESKRKADTGEEASGGDISTNELNIHKRLRKPDDENKTEETVTSPPKKAQKIDGLASTYDLKIYKVETSGNRNENAAEETIGKVVKAKVGNFDISETLPAKVATSENEKMVPDQSSGDPNLSSPSKVQKSSCQKDASNEEEIAENKDVCSSGSVCGEKIETKNGEEKSQLKKESDRHKSTKDWQEEVSQKTDYRESDNGQKTIKVEENVRDDRTGTYEMDNGDRNTIASKESCKESLQNKSDESSMERPKTSTEKDINAVQNRQPGVTEIEGESSCVGKDNINDPHAAKEKDSMKNVVKESVISKDMEKSGDAEEKEENITDLKVIKSSCDGSGYGDSENKVECQNSVTEESNETVSNKETKSKAESQDKLGDATNQSSKLNKDEDLTDVDQYKKPQQLEVGKDNETVKNTELPDLSRDEVKPEPGVSETEADDNFIRTNVTNNGSETGDKKNVALDNSERENVVKVKGVCDAIDNKTNHTDPENESFLSKDKRNAADEENDKGANNMAVEQNDECMEHNDAVKNNVECPKAAKEMSENNANSAGNEGSEHQEENPTGKTESQLPENRQININVSDTVNAKLDIADKEDGAALENRDCQVSAKENEKNSVAKNEETENPVGGVPEESASEESKHLGKADQKTVGNSECKDSLIIMKAKLTDSETARTVGVDITPGFEQGQESVKDKEIIIEKPESKATELDNGQTKVKDTNTTKDNQSRRNCNESVASIQDSGNSELNTKSQENVATDEAGKMVDDEMELDSAPCQEDAKESGQNTPGKIQDVMDDTTGQSDILKDGDQSDLNEHEPKLQKSAGIKETITDFKSTKPADMSNETDPNHVANKIDKDDSMSRTDVANEQSDKGINSAAQDDECQHVIKQRCNVTNNKTTPNDEENGTTLQKDVPSNEVNAEENSTKKLDMVIEEDKRLEPSVIAEDNEECDDDSKDMKRNGGATDASKIATGRTPKEHKEQYTNRDDAKGLEPNIPVNKTDNSHTDDQSLAVIATNQRGIGKDDNDLSVSQYEKRLETAERCKENISDVKESKRDESIETGADFAVDNDKPGGENDESMEVDSSQEKELCKDTNQQKLDNDGLKSDDVAPGEGNEPSNEFMECDAVQNNEDCTGVDKENGTHNESEKHKKSVDPFDDLECQDITKDDKGICDSIGKNTFNNGGEARSPDTVEEMKNLTKDTKIVKSDIECMEPAAAAAGVNCKDSAKEEHRNTSSVTNDKGDSFGKESGPVTDNGLCTDPEKAEMASANDRSGEPDSEDAKLSQDSNNETDKIPNECKETVIGSVSSVSATEACHANENVKEIKRDCQEEENSHCKSSDFLKDEETKSAVVKEVNRKTSYSLNDKVTSTATSENKQIYKNASNCADRNADLPFEKNDKQLKHDDLKEPCCDKVCLPEKINLNEPKEMTHSEDLKAEKPVLSDTVANDSEQNKSVEISKDKVKSNVSESLEKRKMSVPKEESLIEQTAEDITHNARDNRNDASEDKSSLVTEADMKNNTVTNEDEKKRDSLKDENNDVIEPRVNVVATKDERKNSSGPENKNQEMDSQNIPEDK